MKVIGLSGIIATRKESVSVVKNVFKAFLVALIQSIGLTVGVINKLYHGRNSMYR